MRYEVLKAMKLGIQVFWNVTMHHVLSGSWCFKEL